jgi:hypothetical protein
VRGVNVVEQSGRRARKARGWLRCAGVFGVLLAGVFVASACANSEEDVFEVRSLDDASLGQDSAPPTQPTGCVPEFCPNTGGGTPCCITADGPCGMNTGLGCQELTVVGGDN